MGDIMKAIALLVCLILSGGVSSLFADGGFFPSYYFSQGIQEVSQNAIIMYNTNSQIERLYLAVTLSNAHDSNVCWIIATPSLAQFKEITNQSLFVNVASVSSPLLYYYNSSYNYGSYPYGYYGCACMSVANPDYGESSSASASAGYVNIIYGITNANYTLISFSAANTNVHTWLTNNGYYVSDDYTNVLDFYMNANWFFTVIRFNNMLLTDSIIARFEFTNSAPVFPLYISSVNSLSNQMIQLYYLSQMRSRPTNYSVTDVPISNITYDTELRQWNYQQKIHEKAVQYTNNTFFLEFSGRVALNAFYEEDTIREMAFVDSPIILTRYYGNISTEKMRDVYFAPDEKTESYRIYKSISIYNGVESVYYDFTYYSLERFMKNLAYSGGEFGILFVPLLLFLKRRRKAALK